MTYNFIEVFKFLAHNYSIFGYNFQQACQNCNLRLQRIVSRIVSVRKNYVSFHHFPTLAAKKISTFRLGGKPSASLSKMDSRCPSKNFEEKQPFWTIYIYFSWSFSDFEPEIFGISAKNFWRGYQNCILRVQGKILRKINFWKNYIFFLIGFWLRGKNFWETGVSFRMLRDLFAALIAVSGVNNLEIQKLYGYTWNGLIKYGEKFGPTSINDKK